MHFSSEVVVLYNTVLIILIVCIRSNEFDYSYTLQGLLPYKKKASIKEICN